MAQGKTLDMIQFTKALMYRPVVDRTPVDRNRTLAGKKRIKARKLENKKDK